VNEGLRSVRPKYDKATIFRKHFHVDDLYNVISRINWFGKPK